MGRPGVLYISYDGMLEPLGQSQVIAYLERLSVEHRIHLISYEKPADRAQEVKVGALEMRLAAAGVDWHPLTYHKTPTVPATLLDIVQGLVVSLWLVGRHRLSIVHARSYVPALIGLVIKRLTGTRLLFDMRGLWADERVDGDIWPAGGRVYRVVKRIERWLLIGSDHIVTLTHASKAAIEAWPYMQATPHAPISVIPTCADLSLFTPSMAARSDGPFTLGYVGSAGMRYEFDQVLLTYQAVARRRSDARLLIVNRNDHVLIEERLAALGIDRSQVEMIAAEPSQVPLAIRRMDAGTAFYKPLASAIACAPTKLAEYLGCGIPCLGNIGVGDVEDVLEGEGCGVAMREFTAQERERAVDRLLVLTGDASTPRRCRAVSLKHFSVEHGAKDYSAIWASLSV